MNNAIAISTLFTHIDSQLRTAYPDPQLCEQYTWWTIQAITGLSKAALLTNATITLTHAQEKKIEQWITKMVHDHMPIQYLIGSVPFNDCDILVESPILIPRPETEEWCFNLIEELKQVGEHTLTILDLCSGSGCIAIALAKAFPHAHVYAVDINPQAIMLGINNATHNNVTNITFIESDLFTRIPSTLRFDVIVCNPPYIDPQDKPTMDASVTEWEDPRALFAPHHGLAIISALIEQAPHWLQPNQSLEQHDIPQLMIEIDCTQGHAAATLMQNNGYTAITVHTDLEGKDRVISGRLVHVANTEHKQ